MTTTIHPLSAAEARARIAELSDVLIDCVHGGASVSFMAPLTRERADAFWNGIADSIDRRDRILIVADIDNIIAGTVVVIIGQPENQPHRADLSKMLVHRRVRERGLGQRLMQAAEAAALDAGKTLMVLDTGSDAAERLYVRQGWTLAGEIPDYALWPEGGLCPTRVYYKRLA